MQASTVRIAYPDFGCFLPDKSSAPARMHFRVVTYLKLIRKERLPVGKRRIRLS